MNDVTTVFSLLSIKLQPQNSIDKEIDPTEFTDRSDFHFFKKVFNLHVKLSFINESHFRYQYFRKGLRRPIFISLLDLCDNSVLTSIQTNLTIKAEQATCDKICTLPLTDLPLNPAHTHKVVVRDIKSGTVLGEKIINWYSRRTVRLLPTRWYKPVCGFVCPKSDFYSAPYLCLAAEDNEPVCVKFKLQPQYNFGTERLPEVELRLYSPDGSDLTSTLCRPYRDRFDDLLTYTVEMQFTTDMRHRGVHYVELCITGYKVCGFVFTTTGPSIEGRWSDNHLSVISEHNSVYLGKIYDERISDKLSEISSNDLCSEDYEACNKLSEESDGNGFVPVRDISEQLDHMVGLQSVKSKLRTYSKIVQFNKMRLSSDLPALPMPLHSMFLGSPGTGKTTVAKMIGSMLAEAGILSSGHVVVRERATLIGKYYNSEADKTLAAIEEAKGGILFIDEAYQLFQPDDPKDPGRFVIETMLTALAAESSRDWMLILAGYPEPMKKLFDFNPGFKSRIPQSNVYIFEDFSLDELMEIAGNYLRKNNFSLSDAAREKLYYLVENALRIKDETFGNARYIETLIQTEILPSMASRVSDVGLYTTDLLSVIQECDIPAINPVVVEVPRRLGFIA